jgi:hypothetical protein
MAAKWFHSPPWSSARVPCLPVPACYIKGPFSPTPRTGEASQSATSCRASHCKSEDGFSSSDLRLLVQIPSLYRSVFQLDGEPSQQYLGSSVGARPNSKRDASTLPGNRRADLLVLLRTLLRVSLASPQLCLGAEAAVSWPGCRIHAKMNLFLLAQVCSDWLYVARRMHQTRETVARKLIDGCTTYEYSHPCSLPEGLTPEDPRTYFSLASIFEGNSGKPFAGIQLFISVYGSDLPSPDIVSFPFHTEIGTLIRHVGRRMAGSRWQGHQRGHERRGDRPARCLLPVAPAARHLELARRHNCLLHGLHRAILVVSRDLSEALLPQEAQFAAPRMVQDFKAYLARPRSKPSYPLLRSHQLS